MNKLIGTVIECNSCGQLIDGTIYSNHREICSPDIMNTQCPLCGFFFDSEIINIHAQFCMIEEEEKPNKIHSLVFLSTMALESSIKVDNVIKYIKVSIKSELNLLFNVCIDEIVNNLKFFFLKKNLFEDFTLIEKGKIYKGILDKIETVDKLIRDRALFIVIILDDIFKSRIMNDYLKSKLNRESDHYIGDDEIIDLLIVSRKNKLKIKFTNTEEFLLIAISYWKRSNFNPKCNSKYVNTEDFLSKENISSIDSDLVNTIRNKCS